MKIQVTTYPSVKVQLEGQEVNLPAWIANYASGNPEARETLVKNTPAGPVITEVRVISSLADYKTSGPPVWDTDDDDEDGCEGHESLRGDYHGATFYCDGSCQ